MKTKFNFYLTDFEKNAICITMILVIIGIIFCWAHIRAVGNESYTKLTNEEQLIEEGDTLFLVNGVINSDLASIMSAPSSESEVIMDVYKGDTCIVIDKCEYGWYSVKFRDQIGYIYRSCVDIDFNNLYIRNKFLDKDIAELTELTYPSTSVLSSEKIDYDLMKKTVSFIAPNLVSITEALLYNYESYGLKPSFQLAVFCTESGYGTSNLANVKNNICGFNAYATSTKTVFENATQFSTKSECVYKFGELINGAYVNEGRNSIERISTKYCPPNSQNWAKTVSTVQGKIESMYSTLRQQK